MALSAVVLPAPLGPMRPTIRPASTVKFTASRARVVPKFLVRPRASIIAVIVLPRRGLRRPGRSMRFGALLQQLGRRKAQALDRRVNLGPLLFEEARLLVLHERLARSFTHEHAAATPLLHELF